MRVFRRPKVLHQWRVSIGRMTDLLPGVLLCLLVTFASLAIQSLEERAFEHPYIEALVIAILLGMILRTIWTPAARWRSGIAFSAKQLLEIAVMLLGASISIAALAAAGILLLSVIVATVVVTIMTSYGIGRMLGLPIKL